MRIARVLLILAGVSMLCWAGAQSGPASADTVHLKNGRTIEGKVTDNRQTSGDVLVEIGSQGRLTLRGSQVEKIVAGEVKEPVARDYVNVTVAKSGDYYGKTTFEGTISPLSTDKTLVLDVPGGKVEIAKAGIAKITKADPPAAPKPAAFKTEDGRSIKTTHTVELVNGRKLQGNLIATPDTEPVKLEVGGMGVMTIPRDKIAPKGVKESAGTILLPETPTAAPAPAQPQLTPEQSREQMKRELRAEILRELLDQIIDEKVSAAAEQLKFTSYNFEEQGELSNDEAAAIEDAVRELTRQRTQNRVRAENELKRIGSAALPYLEPLMGHPFELTRRAVQRIVREVGDVRGAPMAIDGLNDPDYFVRDLAHEALKSLLPSSIAFAPNDPEASRLAAQAQYNALWDATARARARDSILKRLAAQK
jgi:hypothetical protein